MPKSVPARRTKILKKGKTIFQDGDIGDEMYIIMSGSVEVVKKVHDEEMVLSKLQPGSFFGEMALFGDKHRTATVRALEDTELAAINKKSLDAQLAQVPDWFVAIIKTLVARLKETNKRLKSPYAISLEYSLLKLLYWNISKYGAYEEGGIKAEFSPVIHEIQTILGISKNEMHEKLKDFSFVHMIKYSEDDNTITIPDEEKLKDFLLFLQAKEDQRTRITSAFGELKQDMVSMQYFERIYRLLARKKGIK